MQRLSIAVPHLSIQIKSFYSAVIILLVWLVSLHCYLFHNDDATSTAPVKIIRGDNSSNTLRYGEERVPDYQVFNISKNYEPPLTPGAFIHVGKTAGSTLSKKLRNGCHSFREKPCYQPSHESYISKLTTYYHIPDFENGMLYNTSHTYDFFVITLRDPLERTISAYLFSHPENKIAWLQFQADEERRLHPEKRLQKLTEKDIIGLAKYRRNHVFHKDVNRFECFPTLETFAQHVGSNPDDYFIPFNRTNCTNYARAIFHNYAKKTMIHLYWNYELITSMMRLQDILENKEGLRRTKILVIRREHIWPDWISANKALGQDNVTVMDKEERSIFDRSKLILPINGEDLSVDGKENLCRAIKNEYAIYFELLQRAENLNHEDVQKSLSLAKQSCPNIDIRLEV